MKNEDYVVIRLPVRDYDVIMETLARDMESAHIWPDLRRDLRRAMENMEYIPKEKLPDADEKGD
jgi:hypothetical protein